MKLSRAQWAVVGAGVGYIVLVFLLTGKYEGDLRVIRMVEGFSLAAAVSLYITLVLGPLYRGFEKLPYRELALSVRGPFGAIALAFGAVHGSLAFFKLLGGFAGWGFLGSTYQTATLLGLFSILGLLTLFIAGFVPRVFKRFPYLSKLGYVVGLVIIIHALIVGSHFRDLTGVVPRISFFLVAVLIVLIGRDADRWFIAKRPNRTGFSFGTVLAIIAVIYMAGQVVPALSGGAEQAASQSLHQQHLQQIQALQAGGGQFALSLQAPPVLEVNKPFLLKFSVTRAGTGTPVSEFDVVHEKLAHLVIVDESLEYYDHIHPELKNGVFSITTQFPKVGAYRLYLSSQPKGGSEQVFANRLTVGSGASSRPATAVDSAIEKTVGQVRAKLTTTNLTVAGGKNGTAKIAFELSGANGAPFTNIYPYLGAFGHLVMISASDYSYIHVHPLVNPFSPEETGGPAVEFMVAGNLQPGVYKLFGQFAPNREVTTIPFTVEVTP